MQWEKFRRKADGFRMNCRFCYLRTIHESTVPCSLCFRKMNFLHGIIASDEKWILCGNSKRWKSWVNPGQSSTLPPRRVCSASGEIGKACCYNRVRNNHGRPLLTTIDQFDALERSHQLAKDVVKRASWKCSTCYKSDPGSFALGWESLSQAAYNPKSPDAFRSSPVSVAAASLTSYTFRDTRRDTKVHWWLCRLEAGELPSSRNSQAVRKVTDANGEYFAG